MKLFSFANNHKAVLITVSFLTFLGAIYFFVYIPNNETRLQQQRFRTLQSINRNIHEKIKNSVALLNNLKSNADTSYINYLNRTSKDNFTINLPVFDSSKFQNTTVLDSGYQFTTHNDNRQVLLSLYRNRLKAQGDTICQKQITMKLHLDHFLKALLPAYVFDGYVVFNNGNPVYETFTFGNDLQDSVFGVKNKIISSSVRNYNISGTDYKLFLQPVSFISGNEWVISGLLTKQRYAQERNRLPSSVILLLVTTVLVIFLSFPWIKLYNMGNKDRLTTSDGIASIAVSMLLMSLLFFTFFKYNTPLRPVNTTDSKVFLSQQITAAFHNEIAAVYKKLHFIDTTVASNGSLFKNITSDSLLPNDLLLPDGTPFSKLNKDTAYGQVFWLNSDGIETVKWSAEKMNAPPGNYADRPYFKNIIYKDEYRPDTSKRFYLDQVISWVSGNFTSVLSTPSTVKGQTAAVIAFTMKSLDNPVLPPGYQFAITDKMGKVLYHSDRTRNLNENLITEFSEHKRFISLLEAKTEDAFGTSYFGRDFSVYVKPIIGMPYFIVVFSDLSYKATREMEIYSFTFSMLFLLFGFFILQLLVVFLVSSQRSFFKKQAYNTSWIGPKYTAHRQYNLSVAFNLFVIFSAVAFFSASTFLTYIFILLFSVTITSIFLNFVFARVYKKYDNAENYGFKVSTLRWLLALLLVIELMAFKMLDWPSVGLLLVYETVIMLSGVFFYYHGDAILNSARKYVSPQLLYPWNFKKSFALMALTRLIITSGIPVSFFYIAAYNYEQNISIRYRHLQYANQLVRSLDSSALSNAGVDTTFDRGHYKDDVWVSKLSLTDTYPTLVHSEEDSITSRILDFFRVNFTDLAVKEDHFSLPQASDSSFRFNPLLKEACKEDSVTKTYLKLRTPGKYLVIESAGVNYKIPTIFDDSWKRGLLFWLLLFAALLVFYLIAYNIILKLFCLNLPDLTLSNALDDKIIKNQEINNLLFVIGLPGSRKMSHITAAIQKGDIKSKSNTKLLFDEEKPELNDVVVADLIKINDVGTLDARMKDWQEYVSKAVLNERSKLIIVNHFEYNIQDEETNRVKLNFLEQIMVEGKCKIIILSTIHPLAFIDSVTEKSKMPETSPIPQQDLERWHVLLGHYRIIHLPLRQDSGHADTPLGFPSLNRETKYTHFLGNIHSSVLEVANELARNNKPFNPDELVFKVQISAHYFYMYIWQSLTKEEKFLLYDLAEDNLVNGYDEYNLNMLLAKGAIIRSNGTLKIFNRGFRNFILTAIGNTEAQKIKSRIMDNGNWQSLRTPLLIILLAILLFLLSSQREAYSELMAYLAALGVGIPAVIKLFTLFSKDESKV